MKINVNGTIINCNKGELLSEVLIKHGIMIPMPCGGKGTCRKCLVKIDGKPHCACQYRITNNIIVKTELDGSIASQSSIVTQHSTATELALDIGTTTISLASVCIKDKTATNVITFNNPQRSYGADVISRIEYAQKNGVKAMTNAVIDAVNEKILALGGQFDALHVSGNTAMLHIFLGKDPSPMGFSPYTPNFLDEKQLCAKDYGIKNVKLLHILPSVSAFVGADLTAGVNYIDLPKEKYCLLIDLGTNAEILLVSKDSILATSAAAGPCFEGANISCGMSAAEGAVYSFDESGYKTIGDGTPCGICATGLIDIVAFLLQKEIIDKSGYMDSDFLVADNIKLTQADVRQYQLAKSAVYSGILTLIKKAGICFDDIACLYVSGGFFEKLNVKSAILTGLLPRELQGKFIYLGNSSLLGTVKAAAEHSDFSRIIKISQYVDLSEDTYFTEQFIKNMHFSV